MNFHRNLKDSGNYGVKMKKLRLLNFIPLIMTIPATAIGAMAMYYNEISME